ncbi:unnamed protein product [Lepeophtheirus salmonis]|uniref:(salmon louse) hypothetical protein n=1 Tax=Lepeophtheirus salmonis TaxID=72036 RepID=A0A7R8H948_LEPSM|nr:unnamed protein product [Lepeophtheirus salmonis]CAF2942933.1 unnamed protein product [Lepeophtheirus salmonis]
MCNVKDCSCFFNSSSVSSVIQPPFTSISDIKDCAPTHCTCMDESREDLPKLPEMEDNLIESIDKMDEIRLQKMSTLCDGEEPQFCKCYKREENMSVYGNITEVKECYPTKCTCKDNSMKDAPNHRGAFIRILNYMDLTYGEEESKKTTSFYMYNCQAQRNSITRP